MKNEGIYTLNDVLLKNISINTGANGFVEIANGTNFHLVVTNFGLGAVYQAGRTQAIYKLPPTQGTQSLTIQAANPSSVSNVGIFGTQPSQLARDVTKFNTPLFSDDSLCYPGLDQILINSYQEGETQWYAPFGLASPVLQTLLAQNPVGKSGSISDHGTLLFPPLGTPSAPFTQVYLGIAGFDVFTDANGSGMVRSNLTLSEQPAASGQSLTFQIESIQNTNTNNTINVLQKTFSPPLIFGPWTTVAGGFTAGALFNINNSLNGSTSLINLYYWTMYT